MRRAVPILLVVSGVATMATLIATCRSLPAPSEFRSGMKRADLKARFGDPVRTETLTKQIEHVFGPIETFWSSVPMGSTVEIWSFEARGGRAEVYFLDGADVASGTGFHHKNAVY